MYVCTKTFHWKQLLKRVFEKTQIFNYFFAKRKKKKKTHSTWTGSSCCIGPGNDAKVRRRGLHIQQFHNRCKDDQVAPLLPPSSCPSRLPLPQINASGSGFADISDVSVCWGGRQDGIRGVANNQARYTNLRWQHLVYLKLEGQLY